MVRQKPFSKKTITNPDGTEVTIKTKTEIKDGETEIKNSIEVKGAEVTTKLTLKQETEGDQTKLKVELSTGAEQDIIVLPDEALQTALDELQATNNFTFELKEVVDGDTREAVFSARATQEGKLFGFFDVSVDLETLIDTETGEIIRTDRPFWAFLVVKSNDATVCHVSGENRVVTTNVLVTEVKEHLSHGDSVGECVAICGDSVIVENVESCEVDDAQDCIVEGYSGTQTCNDTCNGFDACVSGESCGDGIVNGPEACDDGNILDGDGCDSLCQVEIVDVNATVEL